MRTFCREILRSATDEVRTALHRPWLVITGIVLPLFWMCVLASIFSTGLMRSVPVACIDNDNTYESREYQRALDSIPSVKLVPMQTQSEAMAALKASRVYALVVFPSQWSEKHKAGRSDGAIELYLSKTYYPIATTLEIDIKRTVQALEAQNSQTTIAMSGMGLKNALRIYDTLGTVSIQSGNEYFNFRPYLLATLMPGVFALCIVLTMIGVIVREHTESRVRQWIANYTHPLAAMLGKFVPWFLFYGLMALSYVLWFAGLEGHAPNGSLLIWIVAAVLLVTAMMAYAFFFVSLMPSWILGLSFAIGSTAPIFPFTGFSYPLESMGALAAAFGECLPLTWFVRLQSMQWTLGSPMSTTLPALVALALFTVIPVTIACLLFPRKLRQWLKEEEKGIELPSPGNPTGLIGRLFEGIRFGASNHDSFMIFVIAVAFYLIFYAWPYMNQTIVNMPVAVVDMDRSEMSRDLTRRIGAASAIRVLEVTSNPKHAENLYRNDKVAGVIVIPETFTSDVLSGKHTAVSLTSNGAYPVKGRAIEMGLTYAVGELMRETIAHNLAGHGANAASMLKLSRPVVTLSDQNLFNSISGYANYMVTVVGPMIVQSVLYIAIVMSLGMWLAARKTSEYLKWILTTRRGYLTALAGYALFAFAWLVYTEGFYFWMSEFSTLRNVPATLLIALLFGFTLVSLGFFLTLLLNSHYYGAQLLVVTTGPLLFFTGTVFPTGGFNDFARCLAQLIPSTLAVPALVSASQNGALLMDLMPEIMHLCVLLVVYVSLGLVMARKRAKERRLG